MRSIVAAAALLLAPAARAAGDTRAPIVEHKPVASTAADAKAVQVFAKVTDESRFFPQVFFRYGPGPYQKPIDMKPVKGQPDIFGANLPVSGPVVEYYIEAYDEHGNGPGRSGEPDKPWRVDTTGAVAEAKPAPAPAPAVPPQPPQAAPSPGGKTWTWIAGGAGAGLLVGGLLAGLAVKSADDAYKARLADQGNNPVSLRSQYDANRSLGTKATVLTIAGGALLATSVALWFLEAPGERARGPRDEERKGGLGGAVVPTDGGGALALHGSF